jgi:hypothetical protein
MKSRSARLHAVARFAAVYVRIGTGRGTDDARMMDRLYACMYVRYVCVTAPSVSFLNVICSAKWRSTAMNQFSASGCNPQSFLT